MKKTTDYLSDLAALVRSKGETGSDYSIAKYLNISANRVSNYRVGRSRFDDSMAIRAASVLGISPAEVLANCHAERAKDENVRRVWAEIAAQSAQTPA